MGITLLERLLLVLQGGTVDGALHPPFPSKTQPATAQPARRALPALEGQVHSPLPSNHYKRPNKRGGGQTQF